ncbi:iron ABC transporter permease [Paenibacillus sp. L3-i20]|uniref:FecCD family ABC transporter permease n=1 Tax=Paenibacillus sp. L3-i20 TaxID=2905833 RepID=UPI001EE01F30|nr:iron ABC transporter permease [Paenibacillus sp. L3-i20]GKU76654.1 iron ABC transporter permease [Paenibacillus sp. L3-i20]
MRPVTVINRPQVKKPHSGRKKIVAILLLVWLVLAIVSIGIGSLSVSPIQTLEILLFSGSNSAEGIVIWSLRLPRLLLASLAGAALAMAGTVLQGVVRNPLASPDIIGVTSGASMMAVFYLAFFNESIGISFLPFFAFAGAALVSFFIYMLAWKRGVSPLRMILVGLGVTALMEACKTLFLIFSPIFLTSQAQLWITGTIYGATWSNVYSLLPWLCVLLPFLLYMVRHLDIQALGDDLTVSLGGRIQLQRLTLIGAAAALAGAAISFVGGIGFIGLMAPHIARKLVGSSHRMLIICSAIVGAILLVTADFIGRTLFSPRDVAAGVFTAAIGAPFFLLLLMKAKKRDA